MEVSRIGIGVVVLIGIGSILVIELTNPVVLSGLIKLSWVHLVGEHEVSVLLQGVEHVTF